MWHPKEGKKLLDLQQFEYRETEMVKLYSQNVMKMVKEEKRKLSNICHNLQFVKHFLSSNGDGKQFFPLSWEIA